jgi:hypothetical protein
MALKMLSFSGTIDAISLLCRAAVEAIERGIEQITNASPERCWYTTVLESENAQSQKSCHNRPA